MARTVLATGLAKVADKFTDEAQNELPRGSPEAHFFMLEAASQRGFEMIDDDGNVYVCNSRQIVALLTPMKVARDAYKWAYEYLQSRMESIDRPGWAHDCDGEIQARIAEASK
jgi:hypothetical protein